MKKTEKVSKYGIAFYQVFFVGYIQAAPYVVATEMHSVQQNNVCTGVVVDEDNGTVIGASVVVKGYNERNDNGTGW